MAAKNQVASRSKIDAIERQFCRDDFEEMLTRIRLAIRVLRRVRYARGTRTRIRREHQRLVARLQRLAFAIAENFEKELPGENPLLDVYEKFGI